MLVSEYEWGGAGSVGCAYHERERLCPEGVRVVEIAHVHYGKDQGGFDSHTGLQ